MKQVRLNWQIAAKGSELDKQAEFLASNGGIYVWIWCGKPERVIYIGETRSFFGRFVTHMSKMLGGEYTVFHMDGNDDFVEFAKKHYAGKTIGEINSDSSIYIPTLTSNKHALSWSRMFFDEGLCQKRANYLRLQKYAFATVESNDVSVKEVEGALIQSLMARYKQLAASDLRRRDSRSNQTLIGNINRQPTSSFTIEHGGAANTALPDEFREIDRFDLPNHRTGDSI